MTNRIWGILLFVIWLMTGCVTPREIAVEVSAPPRVPLPEGTASLSLVLRLPDTIAGKKDDRRTFCREAGDAACRLAAGEKALLGFSERIFEESDLNVMGVIEWMDTATAKENEMLPPLSPDDITRLCAGKNPAEIVVSLEKVLPLRRLVFSSRKEVPRESRNKVWSKTVLYNVEPRWLEKADLQIILRTGWRIYEYKTKQIIFDEFLDDSVSYTVDGASREEIMKKLPSLKTSVERAGYVAGWDFAGWILPAHRTVPRKYYGAPSGLLKEPTGKVKFRQWDQAEKAWREALPAARGRKKAKILYNLALARERKGDYKKALEYITRATKLSPSREMIRYKETIERENRTQGK